MAEEENNNEGNVEQSPKKKLPIKALIAVVVVLLVEAVAITAVFMLTGQPEPVQADTTAVDAVAEEDKEIEQLLLQRKFQNTRTGRAYLYDTTIYYTVKKKHLENAEARKEENYARIEAEISAIFRQAEPSYLMEPKLSTLSRQIKALLHKRIGNDIEGDGKPYVIDVIMSMNRFRAD